MSEFMRGLMVGLIFWACFLISWSSSADELPERPKGYTVQSPRGLVECYPTEEVRKIAEWVTVAEYYHLTSHSQTELLESTRAELTVVSQEAASFESLYKASKDENVRLQMIVVEQQQSYAADERKRKLRAGLTWGSVGVLVVTAVVLGIGWGVSK